MKYKVLKEFYLFELEDKVNRNLEGGWKPQGGISYWSLGLKDIYLQAMVKE